VNGVADSIDIEIAGETLTLLADHAACWARAATLLIADPHFGKAATFRASAIPVPRGTTSTAVARIDALVAGTAAVRIVFLGDYLHAREGRSPETLRVLADWRLANPRLDLVLVRGNHDRRAGDPPRELGVRCVDAPLVEAPFVFAHHPTSSPDAYVLAGHLHPGAPLSGRGRMRERVPCFWFGRACGVLPAFGDFTGLADVTPEPGDRVIAVADGALMEVAIAQR
jgi:uncharacterized protein